MTDKALDRTKAYLMTETRVSSEMSVESLLAYFKIQKMTAHVSILVNQGGIREVIVTEKKEVDNKGL
jgi:CRISPR/Cas system CMR-associated protein Cmr3 (group 5 of RAMP superfamily)